MFNAFDPLAAKQSLQTEVAFLATKREIRNILDSYIGWFDPFAELAQNALDSLEERVAHENGDFQPQVRILIDLKSNAVTVSDNGIGLTKAQYEQFLAPSFSFKSGKTRGHKGVGATYLAYGFNYMQIATKSEDLHAVGKMVDARAWLDDENPASNPNVVPDSMPPNDAEFADFDRGVSITIRFDKTTRPGDLSWLQATTADQWMQVLRLKTGIGSFFPNPCVRVFVCVTDNAGQKTFTDATVSYLWPHELVRRTKSLRELLAAEKRLFEKHGAGFRKPGALSNLDAIHDTLDPAALRELIELDSSEEEIVKQYDPTVYFCYVFSAKVWTQLNENLGLRLGHRVFAPGIQIAANNMPQGELLQVPLARNIGRQNQIHVVVHLQRCRADLGRKGFQKEIVQFCESVARKLIERPVQRVRPHLRPASGVKRDLIRQSEVDGWKDSSKQHEEAHPLEIKNPNFFLPMRRIALTSYPTREQDVIALFNQLLAGGVIRGIKVMATNERLTYDGMYRVVCDEPLEHHIYDAASNPLGLLREIAEEHRGLLSAPKILEYKFSLDGLIEDMESGDKNSNDIDLVVVWETGLDYQGNYHITSLLDPDNLSDRQYHGVTHAILSFGTGQKEMDLIVLEELIHFLNVPDTALEEQRTKYEMDFLAEK